MLRIKLLLAVLPGLIFAPGEVCFGQEWIALAVEEKAVLISEISDNNKPEGCHDLVYKVYNGSVQNAPEEINYATQCIQGYSSVVNVHGLSFSYQDTSISIMVDSVANRMHIGYSFSLLDIKDRGPAALEKLINESGGVYKLKGEKEIRSLKIDSKEQNGIEYYILKIDRNKVVYSLEIYYEMREERIYGKLPEAKYPIVVVDFKQNKNSKLSGMLSPSFFIHEGLGLVTPSKHFKEFIIEDLRIRSTD